MRPNILLSASLAALITISLLVGIQFARGLGGSDAIPATGQDTPMTLTADDAVGYIERGEAILLLALEAFNTQPSIDLGHTLLQISDEYNLILGGLCQVEGTQEACVFAAQTLVDAYESLLAYAKTLEKEAQ